MRLIVIGGVAAGLSAASRARRLDKSLEILVLEKGEAISYGACGLPYYVQGQVRDLGDLAVYSPGYFARERNIAVRTKAEVVSISHPRREVALPGGERLHYDKLVIATGARPNRQGVTGADQPHVFTLHTLEDARRLKSFLAARQPRNAVVAGAGYIGLEVAEALRANGLRVTVLEAGGNLLGREDAGLKELVLAHLGRCGVEVRFHTRLEQIEPNRAGDAPCDLVVLAAGIRPNVEVAAEAGVGIGRTGAIRTDERMETNLSGVFAAGDCCETTHLITGRPVYLPLGTTANKMGRVAGASVAGARDRFTGIVGTSIVRVCGLGVAATGLSAEAARREGFDPVEARIESHERADYFWGTNTTVQLVADRSTGRLLGGFVVGERGVEGRINVIATALTARLKVEDFEQLDLAYAPPYAVVWDPLLIAAQQLTKAL